MSNILEFLPEALEEAVAAVEYYEQCAQGLGARFRLEIKGASTAIVRQPLLWSERRGGYRRVNLPGFPYYIAYFIRQERIIVAAIGHSSRHPDYWKKRQP
jgi:plasmid stabilization system protein ParE